MFRRLDPDLDHFVQTYVTSFLTWDVLTCFHRNQAQGFTADGLSELLGRKTEDVERVLRESIDKFVSAIHDRETRLNVLTAVLRNE